MNSVKGTLKGLLFFFSWNDFCFFPKDFKSVIPFNIYSKCDKIILIGGGRAGTRNTEIPTIFSEYTVLS